MMGKSTSCLFNPWCCSKAKMTLGRCTQLERVDRICPSWSASAGLVSVCWSCRHRPKRCPATNTPYLLSSARLRLRLKLFGIGRIWYSSSKASCIALEIRLEMGKVHHANSKGSKQWGSLDAAVYICNPFFPEEKNKQPTSNCQPTNEGTNCQTNQTHQTRQIRSQALQNAATPQKTTPPGGAASICSPFSKAQNKKNTRKAKPGRP